MFKAYVRLLAAVVLTGCAYTLWKKQVYKETRENCEKDIELEKLKKEIETLKNTGK